MVYGNMVLITCRDSRESPDPIQTFWKVIHPTGLCKATFVLLNIENYILSYRNLLYFIYLCLVTYIDIKSAEQFYLSRTVCTHISRNLQMPFKIPRGCRVIAWKVVLLLILIAKHSKWRYPFKLMDILEHSYAMGCLVGCKWNLCFPNPIFMEAKCYDHRLSIVIIWRK